MHAQWQTVAQTCFEFACTVCVQETMYNQKMNAQVHERFWCCGGRHLQQF